MIRTRALALMTAFALAATTVPFARAGAGDSRLPRSTPESQGVSSAELLAFVEAAEEKVHSLHSFMLVRHGHVVAEGWWAPYSAGSPHSLFSLSKSFTSTAVGLAIAEGKLSLDDEVLKFFPDDAPETPSNNLKSMRVSDLLRMSTGQQAEPARTAKEPWTKTFLAQPVPFKPGTHFLYNTSGTYMLSAIVQKATGQTLMEYLKPRLFEPLGIENPSWELSPQGINTGGYGLSIRTEDIAKFGQLYLKKGDWMGKRIIPESWVEAATARQTSNGSNPKSDWDQGYGYQFWRARHNAYRGDGAFGQFCVVLPDQDAVIAMTSGVGDMQGVLNAVWDKLYPALKPGSLSPDADSLAKLTAKLNSLSLGLPEGSGTPAKAMGKKFVFPANPRKLESIVLEGDTNAVTLVAKFDGVEQRIACGKGEWKKTRAAWGAGPAQAAAVAGAWTKDDTYKAVICLYETPFVLTTTFTFAGDELRVASESNVGFGATRGPELTGKIE